MKRILAIVSALILIVALVGCGKNKREPIQLTLNTEDSEKIMAAAGIALPDILDAKGAMSTVKWFSWYDPFQNYDADEIVNTGYWTFQNKYEGKIVWDETTYESRYDDLAARIVAGTAPDMFPAGIGSTATFPMYCINGTFDPIDEYIDYTTPLWKGMAEAAEYYALGDIHFGIVTELAPRNYVVYNRRVMDEYGYADPAKLFYNDEWTMDVFVDMCKDFSDPDEDRYALQGWYYHDDLVQVATGEYYIMKDDEGMLYSNLDSPMLEVANNTVYDLIKNQCNYPSTIRDNTTGAGMKEGLCLFEIENIGDIVGTVESISAVWGDITEGEVMFVPLPRYKESDGNYYLNAVPSGYMLVENASNPDGVALLAACVRFKIIDPTVIDIDEKQLREIYKWSDEMLEMRKTCYELVETNTRMYRNGNFIDSLNTAYNSIRDGIKSSNSEAASWAQRKESYRDQLDYYIAEQNNIISDYIAGLG